MKTPTLETVLAMPEIAKLNSEYAAARADDRKGDVVRIHAELNAAIAATGYKAPRRGGFACRAGQRQAAERRALHQRRR